MLLDIFKSFLDSVCVKNNVVTFESESSDKFSAVVHCQLNDNTCSVVDYDKCCSVFIKKFSSETQTNWISFRRCLAKHFFRKTFVCHLSKSLKTTGSSFPRSIRDREHDCKARIDFKWIFVNSNHTYKININLKSGLNCILSIGFDHNHDITSEDTLLDSSCTKEPNEYFYSYFKSGLSPIAAKNLHEIYISESAEDDNAAAIDRANDQINPTMRQVMCFHDNWKRDHHEPVVSTLQRLVEIKEDLENNGYYFSIQNDTLDVAIVTPIMKRVFEEFSTREHVVFIESSDSCSTSGGTCATNNLFLTFAFVSSKIGALPIACVLQTSQNFQMSLTLLKETLERATRMYFSPKTIVTYGSTIQTIALKTIFPNSRVLLSVSHIRQNAWKWLSDPNNNVNMNDKNLIMKKFQKALIAPSADLANNAFKELFKELSSKVKDNLRAINYFESWWTRRSEMALLFHNHEMVPHEINMDDCETSIRMLKSTLLNKSKGFTTLALVDLVCSVIENYHQQRLRALARGRDDRVSYHYSRFCETVPDADIVKVAEDEYKVRCGRYLYTVLTVLAVCDCVSGREGNYCEHLVSVEKKSNLLWEIWPRLYKLPVLSKDDRAMLTRIVCGLEKVDGTVKTTKRLSTFEYIDVMKYKQDGELKGNSESVEVKHKPDEDHRGSSESAETKYILNEDSRLSVEGAEGFNKKLHDDCKVDFESAEVKCEPYEDCVENYGSTEEASCASSALGVENLIKVKEENITTNQEIFLNIRKELGRLADLLESSGNECASEPESDLLQFHKLLQDVRTAEQAHRLVVSITHQNS